MISTQNLGGKAEVEVIGRHSTGLGAQCYQELIRRIANQWPASGLTKFGTTRRRAGAKRGDANIYAIHEIVYKGRPVPDVFLEWKMKRGTEDNPNLDTRADLRKIVNNYLKKPNHSLEDLYSPDSVPD